MAVEKRGIVGAGPVFKCKHWLKDYRKKGILIVSDEAL